MRGQNRVLISVVGTLASIAVLGAAAFLALITLLGTCDGDGGFPFAARASPAGRFCSSSWSSVFACAQVGLPVLCILAATVFAVAARRLLLVFVGAGAAALVMVMMAAWLSSLPVDCDKHQRPDSYDCQRY